MKKTIIKSAFVASCIAVADYAGYHSQHDMELSELPMENVEALAFKENTGTGTLYGNSGGPVFVVAPVVHELVVLLLVPVADKT